MCKEFKEKSLDDSVNYNQSSVKEILLHASEHRKLTSFTYEVCKSKITGPSLGQVCEKSGSCRADGSQRTKTFYKKGDAAVLTSDVT